MYIKIDTNLNKVLQKGYVDVVDYEDMEIKYNDELRQFYFLRVGLKLMLGPHAQCYDVITGREVKLSSDWRHFSKQNILPEERAYTVEELEILYQYLLEHKEEYISNEIKDESEGKVVIYPDKLYEDHELDLAYDSNEEEYKYVVVRRIDGKRIYSLCELICLEIEDSKEKEILLKEQNKGKQQLFELRKEQETMEFYNAITGKIISKEELKNYKYCDKYEIFHDTQQYPVKALEVSINQLNEENKTK